MATIIPRIKQPELFFGFVAPVGVDLRGCIEGLKSSLSSMGYDVYELKVTDIFDGLSKQIEPNKKLTLAPEASRYESYIEYGNQLRSVFKDDAALAVLTVARLIRLRQAKTAHRQDGEQPKYEKMAFILHQFKRKEEVDFLRSLYGKQFFQISVYSRRGARVDYLSGKFANTANSANRNEFRSPAESIVQRDYNEASNNHGQKLVKIFHDGDFIINIDLGQNSISSQIERCIKLLFGSNKISPTKLEYAMFVAKAAALRTLDLSRQVGAAIFSEDGEIISMGSNEVPKARGGTYWCDDPVDDREYVRGEDSNERRKNEILREILSIVGKLDMIDDKDIQDSQFMDALEYGRIIHAEMSAIVDAARLGRATKNANLYCTTFPCHMCAKHIVGAGIDKVYFLEPYPKSLVGDLHNDSICVEGNDRGYYTDHPSVVFEHFYGVSPRRYRELFERGTRKIKGGRFQEYNSESPLPIPNLNVNQPRYERFESFVLGTVVKQYIDDAPFDPAILDYKEE